MPRNQLYRLLLFVAGVLLVTEPQSLSGQIRASELGTVSQVIDGTRIAITYSRPRLRGRDPIFGSKSAHWEEVWTPGANWATTLEVSKDVRINDRAVPQGKYSVWMVLRESGNWITILEPDWHRFHMEPPDSNAQQIRIPTRTDQAPAQEVLTWSFPELRVSGGTMAMQWGTTRAVLNLAVQPSLTVTLSEADAAPYIGHYAYVDSFPGAPPKRSTFIVFYDKTTLKARWEPNDEYMQTFAMIRVAPDVFVPGLYDKNGEIYEVLRPDMLITFKRQNGRAMTLEVREDSDELVATGKRSS